jgi:hypothetical protein
MANDKGDLITICGLWANEGRNGEYLSGTLGGARLFVFRNRRKRSDKHPDYVVCMASNAKREHRDQPASSGAVPDDDLPF